MSSAIDLIPTGEGFPMPGTTAFTRLRAGRKPSAYSSDPTRTVEDWTHPDRLEIHGALAASSSIRTPDGIREETTSTAVLTIPDPSADVRLGDRIEAPDGRRWEVTGFPSNDVNAFTAWQPTLEIQLTEWRG